MPQRAQQVVTGENEQRQVAVAIVVIAKRK
jgi:hypothetical protein